jgi:hypothetical protein
LKTIEPSFLQYTSSKGENQKLTSSSNTYLFKTHLREPETKLMRILYTIHKNESTERKRERERERERERVPAVSSNICS